jgi:hypothetical protein
MAHGGTSDLLRSVEGNLDSCVGNVLRSTLRTRIDCLEQILQAFQDIADRDDIHQAAHRLVVVQEWIQNEARCAAADPIFVDLRLV